MNEMMMLVVGLVNLEISFKFDVMDLNGDDAMYVTFNKDGEDFSIVWNPMSMGYKYGLLEAWTKGGHTFVDNEGYPVGYLTAVDILSKIQ